MSIMSAKLNLLVGWDAAFAVVARLPGEDAAGSLAAAAGSLAAAAGSLTAAAGART
jgi:hypothetical protein